MHFPNAFVVLNFLLILCYLIVQDVAQLAFDLYSSLELSGLSCLKTWGNASLEYRNILYVSAPQTLFFLTMSAFTELILFNKNSDRRAIKRLRPIPTLLIGIPLGVIWFCALGSGIPVVELEGLGTYNRFLFNGSVGVLTVTTFGTLLGVEIGRAIGILISGKRRD